ncbi:MFS transporter [Bifidobacterium xylocopae]|uniref:MFS transporter n=1 Tax=Bifidobacterium xylocopae TaxID=2493119 RepID=A0A366KCI5_9BIFI|nr:MFS transporter [Bifidobacterium xylocopae]RBP99455.1 MFS transporter [Bifidobacterium xylocopae]
MAQASPTEGRPRPNTLGKYRYCAAFFIFNLFWMMALSIVASVLLPQRLTDIAPGSKVAISGVFNATTALTSLFSNLIVGNLSDRTRSIFGRRTPWIVSGGILAGISLFLMGVFTPIWAIGVVYCLAMVGLNMMISPVVASLSDRVPDNQRATMSAFISAGNMVGNSLGTLVGAHFITMQVPGWILSGVVMGISGLVTVIIWPKEPSAKDLPKVEASFKSLLESFRPPRKAPDFWLAFAGRSLLLFSYYMVLNYQLFILQDYVGQSVAESAATMSTMSMVLIVVSMIASLGAGPISDKIGRRKIPVVIASLLLAVGYAMPWILHSALGMILFTAIGGFGYGMYGSVDQALNVDVLPSAKEAGKDLGILNIATTLGQMVGPLATSLIVSMTHSYQLVFPTAIILVILACIFIGRIKSVK